VSGIEDHVLLVLAADEIHRRQGPRVLEGVPCWVEVLYWNSMNALIHRADGGVSEVEEMSATMLLKVVDEATELASRPPPW
jgi:hypothetical protein